MQGWPSEEITLIPPHPSLCPSVPGWELSAASEHAWGVSLGSNSVLWHQELGDEDIQGAVGRTQPKSCDVLRFPVPVKETQPPAGGS